MGRYTGSSCKLCRREGGKLFLKGERCLTEKCAFFRRAYAPGEHGKKQVRASEYRIRLREKQKARRIYGLTERQFEKYFDEASVKKGATGEKLLEFLERRLDNVVVRLGFAESRRSARQVITHGGVIVNNRKTDIPSFRVKEGDSIKFKPNSKAFRAATSAAEEAANGVPFLVPLNPTAPEDDHATTSPFAEVIETIVLLKVALICADPKAPTLAFLTFFFLTLGLSSTIIYFPTPFSSAFCRPNPTVLLFPRLVRPLVLVRCPRQGSPLRWRVPR